jgi:hypothetical protein
VQAAVAAQRSDPILGGRAWGERTRGALGFGDQLALLRQAVLAQLTGLPSQVRVWLASGRGADSALLANRPPPDSKLAREALELATEVSPRVLLAHCLRCWLFADLFASRDGILFDDELLYVACVLHDLALTDAHRVPPWESAACFAVHGGEVAARALTARGATPAFANAVCETIMLHMNVSVPADHVAEAHLLHAAAHLDVAGTRAGDLPTAALRAVLSAYSRDGFAVFFSQQMRREASEHPLSRATLLWRAGMPLAIKLNPLDHAV